MPPVFQVDSAERGGIPVLALSGEITSEADTELKKQYYSIAEERRKQVILDFEKTRYINSSGIAVLISIITEATEKEHNVEFVGLTPHFKKVMEIVGLTDFVNIYDSIDEILK